MEQREAERLEQGQQVAEKKLAEPSEVAGLEQQTQRKQRLEAADEARRKQRAVRNRQIKLEREEKLREAGRAAALAAWSKAKNEIEWAEESDGESEHYETQLPADPGVPDNKERPERMRLTGEERPLKKRL